MKPGPFEFHAFFWHAKKPVSGSSLVWVVFLVTISRIYHNIIPFFSKFGPQTSFIMFIRKRKISSSYRCFFAAERLFCLFWLAIRFCQNCVERKLEYIFLSDTDEYKEYYLHRRYYNLAFLLAEIDRINADYEKLDKKILETEAKVFRFRR